MDKIKCITFDKAVQESLPEHIKAKMKADREEAKVKSIITQCLLEQVMNSVKDIVINKIIHADDTLIIADMEYTWHLNGNPHRCKSADKTFIRENGKWRPFPL